MLVGINPSTLKLHFNRDTNMLCRGCCPAYSSSEDDCCCYLDPSPAAWNSEVTYNTFDAVSHEGTNYYSKTDDNDDNEPPDAAWEEYTDCGNADWDSVSPFGGPNKTPEHYMLALRVVAEETSYTTTCLTTCERTGISRHFEYVLDVLIRADQHDTYSCTWTNGEIIFAHVDWEYMYDVTCTGSATPTGSISLNLHSDGSGLDSEFHYSLGFEIDYGETCELTDDCVDRMGFMCPYDKSISITECDITGTKSNTRWDGSFYDCGGGLCPGLYAQDRYYVETISWRPLDCNFTAWDDSTTYLIGDCVAHAGKFYECKLAHTNQEPPNVTYWTDIS